MVQAAEVATPIADIPRIRFSANWWVIVAVGVLIWAVHHPSFWFLNWVHVSTAILWTGTDIFMGFILGPILRKLTPAERSAVYMRLVPRMLFYMPTMSTLTLTAGWYLAERLRFFAYPAPQYYWLLTALIISGVMFVQGTGFLLPTNLRVYFEMRKENPDVDKIQRLMSWYIWVVASQAAMQVFIIIIMTRFRFGI